MDEASWSCRVGLGTVALLREWGTKVKQENLAPESVIRAYLSVLREAILNVRMRIRYGETIDMQELHDLTDALENIPQMLCDYGGWHVEENIDSALLRYDRKYYNPGESERATSLMRALETAKANLAEGNLESET
jgi:hypothetical protein